jgi:hypothetical protein
VTSPPSRTFELTVRLPGPMQHWHVLLREPERSVSLEFDDPKALARFLEQLKPDERPRPSGLR